jgi:hypothetical protein
MSSPLVSVIENEKLHNNHEGVFVVVLSGQSPQTTDFETAILIRIFISHGFYLIKNYLNF